MPSIRGPVVTPCRCLGWDASEQSPTEEERVKTSDKVLWAIGLGSIAVAVVAIALVWRRGEPDYMPETGPEAIAYNYVLALSRKDYDRALGYLSSTLTGRPRSAEELAAAVFRNELWVPEKSEAMPERTSVESSSAEQATVKITFRHFGQASLWGEGDWQSDVSLLLRREDGSWRLVDGHGCWSECWREPSLEFCRNRRLPATVRPAP